MARRVLLVAALLLGVLAARVPEAAASCVVAGPRTKLADAEAAVVAVAGEPVREPDARGTTAWTFQVSHVVKGELPARLTVLSWEGMSNRLGTPAGEPLGYLLYRQDGQWWTSGCGVLDAAELLAAAQPLPLPAGPSRPVALVSTSVDGGRLAALDATGAVTAWGPLIPRAATALCPGSTRVLQVASYPPRISVLDTATATVVRAPQPVISGVRGDLERVSSVVAACLSGDGSRSLVVTAYQATTAPDLWEVDLATVTRRRVPLDAGQFGWAAIDPTNRFVAAVLTTGPEKRLLVLDRRTGGRRIVTGFPADLVPANLSFSPDGARLAVVAAPRALPNDPQSVFLVRTTAPAAPVRLPTAFPCCTTPPVWVSATRLAVAAPSNVLGIPPSVSVWGADASLEWTAPVPDPRSITGLPGGVLLVGSTPGGSYAVVDTVRRTVTAGELPDRGIARAAFALDRAVAARLRWPTPESPARFVRTTTGIAPVPAPRLAG